jgi:hypothetical protein
VIPGLGDSVEQSEPVIFFAVLVPERFEERGGLDDEAVCGAPRIGECVRGGHG